MPHSHSIEKMCCVLCVSTEGFRSDIHTDTGAHACISVGEHWQDVCCFSLKFITYDGTIFSFFNFSNGAIDSSNLASRNDNGSHNIELCTQGPCAGILRFVIS